MPINLTNQEVRPTITQARVTGLFIDGDNSTATVVVSYGHLDAGNFVADRKDQFVFTSATTPSFNQFVSGTPEVLNLRDALETRLVATNKVPGVKI